MIIYIKKINKIKTHTLKKLKKIKERKLIRKTKCKDDFNFSKTTIQS